MDEGRGGDGAKGPAVSDSPGEPEERVPTLDEVLGGAPVRRSRSPDGGPRLLSLELQGYKSFASRTPFEFARTVTAVVGPNGTGKSNISDAIRWVLGEQSYSLLRGRKTEDMIFSGSDARPRAGMASVTIAFDNRDGWLPIDFEQVSISRRAYRDGQNEYLLNGQKVRLREISDLLAGSGLAQRTYTIVGQGLVDSVLSLRAEDRRLLFEEAAGIGLHRSRREEAVRRLERTRRNLERAEDILREVRPRLRSLERQAKRAQAFEQLRGQLDQALRTWYGYHWYRRQETVRAAREQVEAVTLEREALLSELDALGQRLLSARQRIAELRAEHRAVSDRSGQGQARRESLQRSVAVAEARLGWLAEEGRRLEAEAAARVARGRSLAEELAAAEAELARRQAQRKEAEAALQELAAVEPAGDARASVEALGRTIAELSLKRAGLTAALDGLRRLRTPEAAIRQAAARAELPGWLGNLLSQLQVAPGHQLAIAAALDEFGEALAFEAGADLDHALNWLQIAGPAERVSLISLPSADAAAAPLPGAGGETSGSAGPESAPLPGLQDPDCLGTAADLVSVPDPYRPLARLLLGRVLVARDRRAARRLCSGLPADARAVTLQGELFHPAGPIVRPAQGEAASAERRYQEAQAALSRVEQELQAAEAERGQSLRALERQGSGSQLQMEHRTGLAREAEAVARGAAQQLRSQAEALQAEITALRERLSTGQAEAAGLQADLQGWRQEAESLGAEQRRGADRLDALQAVLDQQAGQRAAEEEQERLLRDRLRGVDARYTQAQIELARRQEELAGLERRIQDDFGLVSFEQEEAATVQEPLPLEGLVEHLTRVTALPEGLETELARLRSQMRRIGPVNPEAWDEYREVQERESFLSTQLEDLRKAEAQLQEVIEQLDALMQLEFSRTFEAVALAFQEYFTRLFKGGSARLRLHQAEDLNESGIEIEVRLPGKREQGLSMLSGGERSLTAMALIFALLKLSPTPFCVLDEVDAMLDESNVLRFGEILRELSQNTQFLVITHNRQTIQQAEVVYGVSLGRDNASEVISLRLEEAEKALAA